MGAFDQRTAHIDSALSDFSVAYLQGPEQGIATKAFPVIRSAKQSGKYYTYVPADYMRSEAQKRAPGTPAANRYFELANDSYYCDVVSLAHNVSRQLKANADPAIDPEQDAVKILLQDIMLRQEIDWSAVAFASNWGTNTSPGTVWSNAASTPAEDIATGIRTILLASGKRPNVIAMGADVWYTGLMNHQDLLARLPESSPKIVTEGFVANLLGVDEILVSTAVYNSAQEGLSASNAFAATRTSLLLFHRNPNPGLMAATAGATFVWSDLLGGGGPVEVQRYDVPETDAFPRIEVTTSYDFKVVGSALGYYLSSVVS